MRIVFAGLGVMGGPMAGHLKAAGFEVTGYNRSLAKAEGWGLMYGAPFTAEFEDAVQVADVLMLCVGRDADVRDLVTRAATVMAKGSLIVDHTTTSAKLARELSALCREKGLVFCDAPVSGGQVGAEKGQLSVMVGCPAETYEAVVNLTRPFTKAIVRIGDAGAGQTAKMSNQIAIAGVVQGVAEALHFAKSAGLEPDLVLQAISQGAAGSWQMSNRWGTMSEGEYEFGFAVDWMRKDLGIALDEARENGAHLALTAMVDQFYSEVQAMGGARWDTSSLHARLEARRKPR